MKGIADTLALWVAILFFIFLCGYGPSQAEINQQCTGRGGVISYSDHTWGATSGVGTVVCGDHVAYKVES
jgi:hypothetical protein